MTDVGTLGKAAWRDWNTDGVESTGAHRPAKAAIREFVEAVETQKVTSLDNVAALRLYAGDATSAELKARTSFGDGGGGQFVVKPGDTTTADDGSMVVVDARGRRWWRKWSGVVNVNWFGAPGGDTSDDAPRIEAALNVAGVLGRETIVVMPAGPYRFNTKLTITKSFATLRGVGRSTWIKAYFDGDDVIAIGDGTNLIDTFRLEDMRIDGAVARTGGASVRVRNGYNCTIKGVLFADQQHFCIDLDGGASQFLYSVEDCLLAGGTNGLRVGAQGGVVQDAYLIRTTIGSQSGIGLGLKHCSGFYAEQVSILSCGIGTEIAPGDGQHVTAAFFEKTLNDGCVKNGWLIECAHANSSISDLKLDTCWGSSNGLSEDDDDDDDDRSGMRIGGNGLGVITGIALDTCEFANNRGDGIRYLGGTEVTYDNVHCMCNSREGSAEHHGLYVGANVGKFSVTGGVYGLGGRISVVDFNFQAFGIYVETGASDNYIISGANALGNVTGAVSDGGTGKNKWVFGNLGFSGCFSPMFAQNYLAGLVLSNNSGTPNSRIDVSIGVCADDTNIHMLPLLAKTINCATTGANGLDTGSLANSTWYHVFAIGKLDGTTAALASTSASSPSLPAGYTLKRRIGSFKTDGSANIVGFTQLGDRFLWKVPTVDVNTAAPGTSAVLAAMNVPPGVQVEWEGTLLNFSDSSGTTAILLTSPEQTDTAPDTTATFSSMVFSNGIATTSERKRTDTSGRIRYRSNQATMTRLGLTTFGWLDARNR